MLTLFQKLQYYRIYIHIRILETNPDHTFHMEADPKQIWIHNPGLKLYKN